MKDITKIPRRGLLIDLRDSLKDIVVCKYAISNGILEWSGGSVAERLSINEKILKMIQDELRRRKDERNNS